MSPWPPGQFPTSALGSVPPRFPQRRLTPVLQTPSCPPPLCSHQYSPPRPPLVPQPRALISTAPHRPQGMQHRLRPWQTVHPFCVPAQLFAESLGRYRVPTPSRGACGPRSSHRLSRGGRGPPAAASGSSGGGEAAGAPALSVFVLPRAVTPPQPHPQPYPRRRGCWVGAEALEPKGGLG